MKCRESNNSGDDGRAMLFLCRVPASRAGMVTAQMISAGLTPALSCGIRLLRRRQLLIDEMASRKRIISARLLRVDVSGRATRRIDNTGRPRRQRGALVKKNKYGVTANIVGGADEPITKGKESMRVIPARIVLFW